MASYSEQQRAQAKQRRAADQAQVQKRLQAGRGISLYSANPLEAAVQGIGSFFGITKPPTAFATQMQGKNQLVVPGGWNDRSNMPGNVNVVGRTWDLAQQGANAVYIPRGETTRFNTIVGRPTSAPPAPDLPPPLGNRSAAELAYQQEVSRVAQLTAQDPELQRYEEARQKAKLAGPGSAAEQSAEDLGMQMWAKANPTLAKQVTPGQSGFDAIYKQVGRMPATSFNPLMDRTFGYQTGGGPVTGGQETLGPIPLIPQVDQSLNPASPTFIGGEGPPLMDFSRDNLTPEMIEKYQRQLLQQAKPK